MSLTANITYFYFYFLLTVLPAMFDQVGSACWMFCVADIFCLFLCLCGRGQVCVCVQCVCVVSVERAGGPQLLVIGVKITFYRIEVPTILPIKLQNFSLNFCVQILYTLGFFSFFFVVVPCGFGWGLQ